MAKKTARPAPAKADLAKKTPAQRESEAKTQLDGDLVTKSPGWEKDQARKDAARAKAKAEAKKGS